jgi:hypothetical protein
MKLERNALKALIRESLKDLQFTSELEEGEMEEPGLQAVTAKGSGASPVNTMIKRLKSVPAVVGLLEPMVGKTEALVAIAAIASLLRVDIYGEAAKIKAFQANQDVESAGPGPV